MSPFHIIKGWLADAMQVKYLIVLTIIVSLSMGVPLVVDTYDKVTEEVTPALEEVKEISKDLMSALPLVPIPTGHVGEKNPVMLI